MTDITIDDDRTAGALSVTVLSYRYWHRRFAGDPGVLGSTVTINQVPFTIVGVTPPGFSGEVVGRRRRIRPLMVVVGLVCCARR